MDPLLLDAQLCFALHSASRAMTKAYQPLLDDLSVTYPQYLALLVVWETDGARVSHIGERLHLDSATLTPLLKRLESRGLVERRRATDDERVVQIFVTKAGRQLRARALSIPMAMVKKASMSRAEVVALRSTLLRLAATLRDEETSRSPRGATSRA